MQTLPTLSIHDVLSNDDGFNPVLESKSESSKNKYPLHIAARDGDLNALIKWVKLGFDVNQEDHHSIRPLHIAALFGQKEIVSTLLYLGADDADVGYEGNTALHFALSKGHYEVGKVLLAERKSASNMPNEIQWKNAFRILVDDLNESLINYEKTNDVESLNKIYAIIDIFSVASTADYNCFVTSVFTHEEGDYIGFFPLSNLLKAFASMTPHAQIHDILRELSEVFQHKDEAHTIYNNSKHLLHTFPTGGVYKFDGEVVMDSYLNADGNLPILANEFMVQSLSLYLEKLRLDDAPLLMICLTESVLNTYVHAANDADSAALEQTSQHALQRFQDGEVVLLPSGWDKHFINIILSKDLGYYLTANSGDRYSGEPPDFNHDPAGIQIYKIDDPDLIDVDFIYEILNGEDKIVVDFENAYRHGVFEKVDEIVKESQKYGNCTWESHRDAVEALYFLNLLTLNYPQDRAKDLAREYFDAWDTFHGLYIIDEYMKTPVLPIDALVDIYDELQQSENFGAKEKIFEDKIVEAMLSDFYAEPLKHWLIENNDSADKQALVNELLSQDQIHFEIKVNEPLPSIETVLY